MNKVIFAKYNNYRNEEFNLITTIVSDSKGDKYVYKTAYNKQTTRFLNSFFDKYKLLNEIYKDSKVVILKPNQIDDKTISFEYLEYENFENILLRDLEKGKFKDFKKKVDDFFQLLFNTHNINKTFNNLEKFEHYFHTKSKAVKGTPLIDINFDNFLYGDGKFHLVDFEWTFDSNFETDFLKKRTLLNFLKRNQDQIDSKFIANIFNLTPKLLSGILVFESKFIEKLTNQKINQFERLNRDLKSLFIPEQKESSIICISEVEMQAIENRIHILENKKAELSIIKNSLIWKLSKPLRNFSFIKKR